MLRFLTNSVKKPNCKSSSLTSQIKKFNFVQYSNTNPIKYLFDIIKNTNEKKLKLSEKRNNMFHSAAKSNECFPIV